MIYDCTSTYYNTLCFLGRRGCGKRRGFDFTSSFTSFGLTIHDNKHRNLALVYSDLCNHMKHYTLHQRKRSKKKRNNGEESSQTVWFWRVLE